MRRAVPCSTLPGKYVKIHDTIRGFREIIEGLHDNVREQAFYMAGSIDDVIERAKAMA